MSENTLPPPNVTADQSAQTRRENFPPLVPVPNYTLSTVCANCAAPVIRRACKVRCERCGFVWDCSEL